MQTKKIITAKELIEMEMKKMTWYVNEILPEGVTLVVAKPKVGKSALILYLMVQIALQNKIWDTFSTKKAKILYLPYDDPMRRMKDRITRISEALNIGNLEQLNNLYVRNKEELKKISVKDNLVSVFSEIKQAGFDIVIIDTLHLAFDFKHYDFNVYKNEYDNMSLIKKTAEELGLSLVIVHHAKKGESLDVIDAASGSNGMTGAVDTIWTIINSQFDNSKLLHVTGKEVETNTYQLQMEPDTFLWSMLPNDEVIYEDAISSPQQKQILEYIQESKNEVSSGEIAAKFERTPSAISQALRKLERKGYVHSPRYGKWELAISKA